MEEFLAGTIPFIEAGLVGEEPVLVAVNDEKIELLRDRLGGEAGAVRFVEISAVGRNPARLIPIWRDFVALHEPSGAHVRGVGEPVWPERSSAELAECENHEALVNLAFADAPELQLLCPYDSAQLGAEVISAARRCHPWVAEGGVEHESSTYEDPASGLRPFTGELAPPPGECEELAFDAPALPELRHFVWARANAAGLATERQADLMLAMTELASNSVRHGGGAGKVRIWCEPEALVIEVTDCGHFEDPLVGREAPEATALFGRGLWLVNQMCDLLQLRSGPEGSTARMHFSLA